MLILFTSLHRCCTSKTNLLNGYALFETKAILLMPVLGFVIFAVASFAMGGFPMVVSLLAFGFIAQRRAIGGTTSGGTVPFDPVCPESYSELYPMMWTIALILL